MLKSQFTGGSLYSFDNVARLPLQTFKLNEWGHAALRWGVLSPTALMLIPVKRTILHIIPVLQMVWLIFNYYILSVR